MAAYTKVKATFVQTADYLSFQHREGNVRKVVGSWTKRNKLTILPAVELVDRVVLLAMATIIKNSLLDPILENELDYHALEKITNQQTIQEIIHEIKYKSKTEILNTWPVKLLQKSIFIPRE